MVNLRNIDKTVKEKNTSTKTNLFMLVEVNAVAELAWKIKMNMRITTRYHGGNNIYRLVLQN